MNYYLQDFEVSFYISILKNKDELKDWYQMAKDFELKFNKKPINKVALLKQYEQLEKSLSNTYKKLHFSVGVAIFEEMENFSNMLIYSFQ